MKGWTAAVDLRAGDILVLADGSYAIVEKTEHEILENPIKVYNFEVADFHTYFVGECSVLVHNDCSNSNSSSYTNVTKKGSIFNRNTDVTRAEFENNLQQNGWKATQRYENGSVRYENNGARYFINPHAKSYQDGPSAYFTPAGVVGQTVKIRLRW